MKIRIQIVVKVAEKDQSKTIREILNLLFWFQRHYFHVSHEGEWPLWGRKLEPQLGILVKKLNI